MAFKHITLLWSEKSMLMGHVGDTACLPDQKNIYISPGHVGDRAFLPGQKNPYHHIRGIGGLAFDSAYDIK